MDEVVEQFIGAKTLDGAAAEAVGDNTVGILLLGRENCPILSSRKVPCASTQCSDEIRIEGGTEEGGFGRKPGRWVRVLKRDCEGRVGPGDGSIGRASVTLSVAH